MLIQILTSISIQYCNYLILQNKKGARVREGWGGTTGFTDCVSIWYQTLFVLYH